MTLYTNNCPKCKILKQKLDEKGFQYEVSNDMNLLINKGYKTVPILEVEDIYMTYIEAVNWIKEQNQ